MSGKGASKKPRLRARKKLGKKVSAARMARSSESQVVGVGFVVNRKDLAVLFVGSQHVLLDESEAKNIGRCLLGREAEEYPF